MTDLELIKIHPINILLVDKPDITLQKAAIQKYAVSIQFTDNIDSDIKLAALWYDHRSKFFVGFIKDGSNKTQLFIFEMDVDTNFYHIIDPHKDLDLIHMSSNGYSMNHVKNPNRDILLGFVKNKELSIQIIEDPDDDVQMVIIQQNSWLFDGTFNYK